MGDGVGASGLLWERLVTLELDFRLVEEGFLGRGGRLRVGEATIGACEEAAVEREMLRRWPRLISVGM